METSEEILKIIMERQVVIIEMMTNLHVDVRLIKSRHNIIDGDPLLNAEEVCHVLNVSERQVRRYREEDRLCGFLFGGRRLYRKSEVDAFIVKTEREAKEKEMKALGYYDESPDK